MRITITDDDGDVFETVTRHSDDEGNVWWTWSDGFQLASSDRELVNPERSTFATIIQSAALWESDNR